MLEINPGLTIWTFIIFGFLMLLLSKTAWKPMLASLRNREKAISDALERAEQARVEAERIIAENRLERQRAEEELQKSLREGREYADRMRTELMARAEAEARVLVEQARGEIRRDTQAAIVRLREEAADLAIMATSKLLQENLNDDKHKKVVDRMLADLPATV